MRPPIAIDAPGNVLVIDDMESNREVTGDCLGVAGHVVRLAAGAAEALDLMRDWEPDVILLDIMMPKINGMQFCRQLKDDPTTSAIPIIMMTAMSDRTLRIRGIDAGANEFILKPIEPAEVALRVRNAIRSKRLYDNLKSAYGKLQMLEHLRDDMTHMLVHDMRSPLMAIHLCLEAVQQNIATGRTETMKEDITTCMDGTTIVTEMIGTMLDISRLEAGAMPLEISTCNVNDIIKDGVARVSGGACVPIHISTLSLVVNWDKNLVTRTVANLVSNALKYGANNPIRVSCCEQGSHVEIQIDDTGSGIPPQVREHLFEKYHSLQTGDQRRNATGLGLYFCKQVVIAHGGDLGVVPLEPKGSRFWLRLPRVVIAPRPADLLDAR